MALIGFSQVPTPKVHNPFSFNIRYVIDFDYDWITYEFGIDII